jgi:hypothetical protein
VASAVERVQYVLQIRAEDVAHTPPSPGSALPRRSSTTSTLPGSWNGADRSSSPLRTAGWRSYERGG